MRMPHPSTVLSIVALTASLGTGGAYAATKLAANSVGSAQIRDRSVQVRDLAPSARPIPRARLAQTVADVINDPATGLNITVHGEKGDKGEAGTTGPVGPAGPAGANGVAGLEVATVDATVAASDSSSVTVTCPDGKTAVGGGARLNDRPATDGVLQQSSPDGAGWTVVMANKGPITATVRAFAVCATIN